ncbi:MAG TPA: metal ABC transporter ATP-binding protein [Gemmatimonadales bacterium]|nr:metal ABC transporter ATP-binding protein [Gemmatimonadales bacterium]
MNALVVEHLTVRFGTREVLKDLSFSVPTGTTLAIIGPNGAGKTVLVRALIGALPHEGSVQWAPGTRLGYVPQKLDIERDMPVTGRDLLRARARLLGASATDVQAALARVGLALATMSAPIGTLSGGQFQRLLVAFALLGNPTVLLLDEPTAGVDEPGEERVQQTVRRLVDEGVSALVISHDLTLVYREATNVLCLSPGHTCFGAPRAVLSADLLSEVYGAPIGLHLHDEPRA